MKAHVFAKCAQSALANVYRFQETTFSGILCLAKMPFIFHVVSGASQ